MDAAYNPNSYNPVFNPETKELPKSPESQRYSAETDKYVVEVRNKAGPVKGVNITSYWGNAVGTNSGSGPTDVNGKQYFSQVRYRNEKNPPTRTAWFNYQGKRYQKTFTKSGDGHQTWDALADFRNQPDEVLGGHVVLLKNKSWPVAGINVVSNKHGVKKTDGNGKVEFPRGSSQNIYFTYNGKQYQKWVTPHTPAKEGIIWDPLAFLRATSPIETLWLTLKNAGGNQAGIGKRIETAVANKDFAALTKEAKTLKGMGFKSAYNTITRYIGSNAPPLSALIVTLMNISSMKVLGQEIQTAVKDKNYRILNKLADAIEPKGYKAGANQIRAYTKAEGYIPQPDSFAYVGLLIEDAFNKGMENIPVRIEFPGMITDGFGKYTNIKTTGKDLTKGRVYWSIKIPRDTTGKFLQKDLKFHINPKDSAQYRADYQSFTIPFTENISWTPTFVNQAQHLRAYLGGHTLYKFDLSAVNEKAPTQEVPFKFVVKKGGMGISSNVPGGIDATIVDAGIFSGTHFETYLSDKFDLVIRATAGSFFEKISKINAGVPLIAPLKPNPKYNPIKKALIKIYDFDGKFVNPTQIALGWQEVDASQTPDEHIYVRQAPVPSGYTEALEIKGNVKMKLTTNRATVYVDLDYYSNPITEIHLTLPENHRKIEYIVKDKITGKPLTYAQNKAEIVAPQLTKYDKILKYARLDNNGKGTIYILKATSPGVQANGYYPMGPRMNNYIHIDAANSNSGGAQNFSWTPDSLGQFEVGKNLEPYSKEISLWPKTPEGTCRGVYHQDWSSLKPGVLPLKCHDFSPEELIKWRTKYIGFTLMDGNIPVPNADIFINGKNMGKTDVKGIFKYKVIMDSDSSGKKVADFKYTFNVEKPGFTATSHPNPAEIFTLGSSRDVSKGYLNDVLNVNNVMHQVTMTPVGDGENGGENCISNCEYICKGRDNQCYTDCVSQCEKNAGAGEGAVNPIITPGPQGSQDASCPAGYTLDGATQMCYPVGDDGGGIPSWAKYAAIGVGGIAVVGITVALLSGKKTPEAAQ